MKDSANHPINEGDRLAVHLNQLVQAHIEKISHITPLSQPPHIILEATVKLKWRVMLAQQLPNGQVMVISGADAQLPFPNYVLIPKQEDEQQVPKSSLVV